MRIMGNIMLRRNYVGWCLRVMENVRKERFFVEELEILDFFKDYCLFWVNKFKLIILFLEYRFIFDLVYF